MRFGRFASGFVSLLAGLLIIGYVGLQLLEFFGNKNNKGGRSPGNALSELFSATYHVSENAEGKRFFIVESTLTY